MKYTIDAKDKKLGRVATEVSMVLQSKNVASFVPNKDEEVKVVINNASGISITDKKKEEKIYKNYSGFPGGLKHTPMNKVIEKKGIEEVIKKAVYGMLPDNRLRKNRMKRLEINE
jgi:large subunit ribosomal protein L13